MPLLASSPESDVATSFFSSPADGSFGDPGSGANRPTCLSLIGFRCQRGRSALASQLENQKFATCTILSGLPLCRVANASKGCSFRKLARTWGIDCRTARYSSLTVRDVGAVIES